MKKRKGFRPGRRRLNFPVAHSDGQPAALAGLWERWSSKDKSKRKETFTVVTTEPNTFAAEIHDRMPIEWRRTGRCLSGAAATAADGSLCDRRGVFHDAPWSYRRQG